VAELKEDYDLVFFDSPPMIGVSDSTLLMRQVDAAMMVIQHRKYPRALSARAKGMIDSLGGNLLGVVLNNINVSRDHSYYYYHQHYYYYPKHGRPTTVVEEPEIVSEEA
jgi:Mrp family chromosome partitioning ATPase